MKENITHIKQLIADGACDEAIVRLSAVPVANSCGMENIVMLLQNYIKPIYWLTPGQNIGQEWGVSLRFKTN